MKETKVISAFPGTGKTHFYNNNKKVCADSDSSLFDKMYFPENYIEHIHSLIGKVDIIFVSSHKTVRQALINAGIEFLLIHPNISLKDEYISRFKRRGSLGKFIEFISDNWQNFIEEIQQESGYKQIMLNNGEYVSDFLLQPITLKDKVTHEMIYDHHEIFDVVGLREYEVELKGDFSGGTNNISQVSWVSRFGIKKVI